MANPYRGEVDIKVKEKTYTLRMGAAEIAKMESALEVRGQALWARLLQQSMSDFIKVGKILLEPVHKNVGDHVVCEIIENVGLGGKDGFCETVWEAQGQCRFGPEWPDIKARMVKEQEEGTATPNA